MTSSCMTKLEFLLEPYMVIFRLGKLPLICYLFCIEFSQALLMPYERFVMPLKIKITYIPPTYALLLHQGQAQKHAFHLDPPKNVLLLHWEKTPKICFIGFHQINALSSCCYLSKVCCRKETWAMQKLFIKNREEERRIEKNGQVSEVLK